MSSSCVLELISEKLHLKFMSPHCVLELISEKLHLKLTSQSCALELISEKLHLKVMSEYLKKYYIKKLFNKQKQKIIPYE